MSSGERREEILEAAVAEFAIKGLYGTSTDVIAERAGVSQPYLFRLFGTKKYLFMAAVQRNFERTETAFRRVAESNPENVLEAMGVAYCEMLSHREQLLLQMQSYVACSDPEVRKLVRKQFGTLYLYVQQASGASDEELRDFFAVGMLMNVGAAMDLPAVLCNEPWAAELLAPFT
jgi:AcrR family transcriptional regulator